MGDLIWHTILHMTKKERDYWRSKFSKEQWAFMCQGYDW